MNDKFLNYTIVNPGTDISLDLFEAERYSAAIVVQPLIGNLVFYSNHGRYEPRLASHWLRTAPNVWKFFVRDGFSCENGESITAASFKQSLERILLAIKKRGDSPIFSRLQGYSDFLRDGLDLAGLKAEGNELTFTFDRPIRTGLVEVLSFAPFGYICADNLNADGTWKNREKFISSGPYQIAKISLGKEYILELRSQWKSVADALAPEFVKITHAVPEDHEARERLIVDSVSTVEGLEAFTSSFRLVPEYLNSVLLGNLENGYFSKLKNRKFLRAKIESARLSLPEVFKNHIRASAFYSGLESLHRPGVDDSVEPPSNLTEPVVIEGKEPTEISFKYYTWQTLKVALEAARIPYRFANNDPSWDHTRSKAYDIRLRTTSVGGSPDAWGIDVLFCSLIGPGLPDPSGRVCDLIELFEKDVIDEKTLGARFLDYVDQDAAIIPISHNGGQLYLGTAIVRESLNPTLNVMRFDQLQMR